MPSNIPSEDRKSLGLDDIATQELFLRKGQANDALENLRLALGHKALYYRTVVRKNKTNKKKTRSWAEVKQINNEIQSQASSYKRARRAMVSLGADKETLKYYQPLTGKDLAVSKDIVEENRFGQRNDVMAWFWRVGERKGREGSDWMQECKPRCLSPV